MIGSEPAKLGAVVPGANGSWAVVSEPPVVSRWKSKLSPEELAVTVAA